MLKDNKGKTHSRDIIDALRKEVTDHMHRVGLLAGLLSEKAHMGGVYKGDSGWNGYKHFGEAAFYHDIGKAWLPKDLLDKHGKHTKQEELIVQLHPVLAVILFKDFKNDKAFGIPQHLLARAFRTAVYHHERWDGKGYPYGIGADSIPLIARITAICDAYDAMTSIRTYKETQSHGIACRELQENAGTQFVPLLIMTFLENESAFGLVMERQMHDAG